MVYRVDTIDYQVTGRPRELPPPGGKYFGYCGMYVVEA